MVASYSNSVLWALARDVGSESMEWAETGSSVALLACAHGAEQQTTGAVELQAELRELQSCSWLARSAPKTVEENSPGKHRRSRGHECTTDESTSRLNLP